MDDIDRHLEDIEIQAERAGVKLTLARRGRSRVEIAWLNRIPGTRRGTAAAVMRHLCTQADLHGIELGLGVLAEGGRLLDYYAQFGFERRQAVFAGLLPMRRTAKTARGH